jgi:hypothetical protein
MQIAQRIYSLAREQNNSALKTLRFFWLEDRFFAAGRAALAARRRKASG